MGFPVMKVLPERGRSPSDVEDIHDYILSIPFEALNTKPPSWHFKCKIWNDSELFPWMNTVMLGPGNSRNATWEMYGTVATPARKRARVITTY
jgi:hypothetical protein